MINLRINELEIMLSENNTSKDSNDIDSID